MTVCWRCGIHGTTVIIAALDPCPPLHAKKHKAPIVWNSRDMGRSKGFPSWPLPLPERERESIIRVGHGDACKVGRVL